MANVSNLKVAVFPKNQADLRRADFVAKQRAMEDSLMALEVLLLQKMDSVFHMMCYMTIYLFTSSAFINDCTRLSIFLLFFMVSCVLWSFSLSGTFMIGWWAKCANCKFI